MNSLAVVSPKGGVGKTTIALNVAYAFAQLGHRTLLVDADPQGGIGHSLRGTTKDRPGLVELASGARADVVVRTKLDRLAILPIGQPPWGRLSAWYSAASEPTFFEHALGRFDDDFDLVVIDTPAGLAGPTHGALAYSSHVLLPVQTEPLAIRTVTHLLEVLTELRASGARTALAGVVLSMAQFRDESSLAVSKEAWALFPDDVMLDSYVPRDPVFVRASAAGVPVGLFRRRPPPVAAVFDRIAAELEPKLHLSETADDDQALSLVD